MTRDEISTELMRIENRVHEVKSRLWECRTRTGRVSGTDLRELIELARGLRERTEQFEETLQDAGYLEDLLGDEPL